MGDRVTKLLVGILLLAGTAQAATIVQSKAKSAIIELTDAEINSLHLAAGQNIQFTVGNSPVQASIVKIVKNKILIKSDVDLTGNAKVPVEISAAGGGAEMAAATTPAPARGQQKARSQRAAVNKSASSKKPWIAGVNFKYVASGSTSVQFADTVVGGVTVPGFTASLKTTGFVLSGIGFYYFGQWGAGAEVEYASLKGSDANYSSTITQMQLSGVGEYKFGAISAGASLTIASNYKAGDNFGNDSSLNGMGFGIFGTYQITPQIRGILDYKAINYSLEGNSVKTTLISIGGGYYF